MRKFRCGAVERRRREAEIGWRFADAIKFYVRKPLAWRLRVGGQFRKYFVAAGTIGSIAGSHPAIVELCFRGPVDDPGGRLIVRNRFCAKNEADPPDVADQRSLIRRVDIATQPTHVNVNQVRVRNKFVVPDIFQEGGSCQQFAAPPHHVLEQLEFPGPQIDPTAATRRGSIDEVELQRSHAQHRIIRQGWLPDRGGPFAINSTVAIGCLGSSWRRRDPRMRSTTFSSALDSSELISASPARAPNSAGTSWKRNRTRTGRPSMSARNSFASLRIIAGSRLLRATRRCCPPLGDEFSSRIDLCSKALN